MKFSRKFLQNLAYEEHDEAIVKLIEDEVCDHSRWSVIHSMIFKVLATGKYYCTSYSVGATEYQDEGAYEYSSAEIECTEVIPKKIEVIQYVEVKEDTTNKSV